LDFLTIVPPTQREEGDMAKGKAKKATKNRVDQEVKPMDQDPLQKFDRLGEKDPAVFRKELDKWMRDNNRVKSAR
jgi:hypothetical protein